MKIAVAAFYLLNALTSTVDRMSDQLYEKGNVVSLLMLNADRDMYQAQTAFMAVAFRQLDAGAREAALASYEENLQQTKDRLHQAFSLVKKAGWTAWRTPAAASR